jgi:hypothetical protein
MQSEKTIIMLFDLDGVLIRPIGYRRAFYDTARFFLRQAGLENLVSIEGVPELFESNGITCEWDMLPLMLLICLDAFASFQENFPEFSTFEEFAKWSSANEFKHLHINFKAEIDRLGCVLKRKQAPADEILAVYQQGQQERIFSHLQNSELVQTILSQSRNFLISNTSRVFENLVLGDQKFINVLGQRAAIRCESYLETFDEVLIEIPWRLLLKEAFGNKTRFLSLMTARPTLPPVEIDLLLSGYLPEGESAKSKLGLDEIPLIGFGKLQYLAELEKINPDTLIKPSPVQALAAILAAYHNEELHAIEIAYRVSNCASEELPGLKNLLNLPDTLELHIFEDSFVGIRACLEAIKILEKVGFQISFNSWGISEDKDKIEALQACGARVYANINQALAQAMTIDHKTLFKRYEST